MTRPSPRQPAGAISHRLRRKREQSLLPQEAARPAPREDEAREREVDVSLDCGWGELVFAHTFKDQKALISRLLNEKPDRRDIAFYVRDPHVLLALAPQEIFLDPSHTFRLELSTFRDHGDPPRGFVCPEEGCDVQRRGSNSAAASLPTSPA